ADFRQQLREPIHAVTVVGSGARDLSDSDRQHLGQSALGGATEPGVRLDAVDHDNAVGFGRVLVQVNGRAIREMADNHGVHARLDWDTSSRLADSVALQHLLLALRRGGAMAAHGRKHERPGAKDLKLSDYAAGNFRDVGHAAAAASYGYDLARRDPAAHLRSPELTRYGSGD